MPLTRKQKQRNAAMLKTAEPVPPTQLEIEKMSGEEFGRAKRNATEYYRLDGNKKDGKKVALEYAKQTPQFSQRLKELRAVKDWRFGAALCAEIQTVLKGWPSYNSADHIVGCESASASAACLIATRISASNSPGFLLIADDSCTQLPNDSLPVSPLGPGCESGSS